MRVIPTFDPFEHSHLGFRLSFEPTAVQQFTFERGKEALGHRIVVRVAHGTHRGHDAGFSASLAKGVARVLGGFIRLLQHSQWRLQCRKEDDGRTVRDALNWFYLGIQRLGVQRDFSFG